MSPPLRYMYAREGFVDVRVSGSVKDGNEGLSTRRACGSDGEAREVLRC